MNNLKQIVVTGANGFVGKALVKKLLEKKYLVRAVLRNDEQAKQFSQSFSSPLLEYEIIGDISEQKEWSCLHGAYAVIHLAARVHVLKDQEKDPHAAYRRINFAATQQLAQAAVKQGVKHFIYLSSIKVNGEQTPMNKPFTEKDLVRVEDAYGKSKWEAEQFLRSIKQMDVTILRPPLVYGKAVKANFASLVKLVQMGLPLPLASIKNKRSMIYVENLADAIIHCLSHANSAGKTYLLSDNEVLSTAELIHELGIVLNKPARLFALPLSLMRMAGKITGKSGIVDRLTESLVVDSTKIKQELNWNPPYSLQQALRRDFSN